MSDDSRVYVPCEECRGLYVEDIVHGYQLLDPLPAVVEPTASVVYSPKFGEYPQQEMVPTMEIGNVAIATFARFFEATPSGRVRVVRDARLFQSDPKSYAKRDYYFDLRNTLRQTHWQTNDISTFEAALDPLIAKQTIPGKQEHVRTIGRAYIDFWKKRDAQFFRVAPSIVEITGLRIHVVAEVGMRYNGDNLALKLALAAPKPTRHFRQVIQYLTTEGLRNRPNLQQAIWDVRREEILPHVPIPRDFRLALEGEAVAFRQIWESLNREEEN